MNNNEYFKKLVQDILFQLNKIRNDPQCYINIVKTHLKYLKGNYLQMPGEVPIYTFEGKKALEEAIEFLNKKKPVESVTFEQIIANASQDHVNDIGPKGSVNIYSSNGDDLTKRIEKYCEWDTICVESFNFGGKTGEEVVMQLLIDDGYPNRENREYLFSEEIKYIGIASGYHKEFNIVNVLTYVGSYRKKGETLFNKESIKYPYPNDINKSKFKSLIKKINTEDKASENLKKNSKIAFENEAPEGTVSMEIFKTLKKTGDKEIIVEKKIYKLKDDSIFIIEKEYF